MSIWETVTDQLTAISISTVVNWGIMPLFGFHIALIDSLWLTLILSAVSFTRKYVVRRIFNWLHVLGY